MTVYDGGSKKLLWNICYYCSPHVLAFDGSDNLDAANSYYNSSTVTVYDARGRPKLLRTISQGLSDPHGAGV